MLLGKVNLIELANCCEQIASLHLSIVVNVFVGEFSNRRQTYMNQLENEGGVFLELSSSMNVLINLKYEMNGSPGLKPFKSPSMRLSALLTT